MPVSSFFFKLFVAVGLVSASVISFQVVLTQIFAITQWYHFAFMIVSLAMLGFGASGTLLSLFRRWFEKQSRFMLAALPLATALSMGIAVPALQLDFFRFDSYLLFVERAEIYSFVFCLILLFVPFLTSGLFAGLVFFRFNHRISRLYFFDLAGAGLGSLIALGVMNLTFPWQAPAVLSLLPFAGAVLLSYKSITGMQGRKRQVFHLSALIVFAFIAIAYSSSDSLPYSQYKNISTDLNLPDALKEYEGSSPRGLVEVVSSPALRFAPGLSLTFTGEVPVNKMIYNDGNAFGPVFKWDEESGEHIMDYAPQGLSYRMVESGNALFIGNPAVNITQALTHDFDNITALEPHRLINEVTSSVLDTIEGVNYLNHDKVDLKPEFPRLYLSSSKEKFDLVGFPMIGRFGGGSGLDALEEQFHFTTNAFLDVFDNLSDNGLMQVSVWLDYPFRAPLKTAATLAEVLEIKDIQHPEDHLFAIRSWGMVSFFVKKAPLSDEDIEKIREYCREMNFDPVVYSGMEEDERTRYNDIEDRDFFVLLDEILEGDRQKVYENYSFNIQPATDDRPYFSQYLKFDSFREIDELFGRDTLPFFELGYALLFITFLATGGLSVVFILLPLFFRSRPEGQKLPVLLYFTGIGAGFMFVEMIFIQQLILLLGDPAYSVAFVIAFMLISSGVGSHLSGRLADALKWMKYCGLFLAFYLVGYGLFFSELSGFLTDKSLVLRILGCVVLVGIPSMVMGLPFPLGIRQLGRSFPGQIPWAWGINGCISVISTALATFVMVEWGASTAFYVASTAYLLLLPAAMLFSRKA